MSAYIPVELDRRVRARFNDCCAYCRTAESLTVAIFEFEPIKPLSAGGETSFENLCFSCPTCNRYKAKRQAAIDPISEQVVPLFHPHQESWYEHFAWNRDFTEIIGLPPTANATIAALKMNRPQLTRVRKMWVTMNEHPPKSE